MSKTTVTWAIQREMRSLGADFMLCLSEISARFEVMVSTTKVKYSLFSELDESISLIFIVCVWQKNLPFCGELLVELVSFSMTY